MHKIAICFLTILISFAAISQTAEETENLLRLAEELRRSHEFNYSKAIRIADSLGLSARIETEEGQIYQLAGIGEDGLLIYYGPDNAEGAALVNADKVHPGGSANLDLTGAGQTLGIWEGGVPKTSHNEFMDQEASRVTIRDGATNVTDHASHVGGTMIAAGIVEEAKGISFEAHLDAYDHSDAQSEMATAAAEGLKVSNHSYGPVTGWRHGNFSGASGWHWFGNTSISATEDYRFGFYTSISREWDEIAYHAPHYLIVKSAGNDRGRGPNETGREHFVRDANNNWMTSTAIRDYDGGADGYDCLPPRSTSKNNMVVGGVRANKDMYTFGYSGSSWGPTDDGRIKPDIVAKSVYVYSPISEENDEYAYLTGTSMSAPMVAGAVGLISQHQENLNPGELLLSSTVKGLLLHSADDMISGAPGPDYRYGWGLMDVEQAIGIMSKNDPTNNVHIQELTLQNGDEITIPVRARGHEALRATIVWTDPPGTVPPTSLNPTDLILVNDLDMRLHNPNTTHKPYILDPQNPSLAATTGDNFRDNIEMVHVEDPDYDEIFEISISHKGILANGSQDFSLVVTGNMEMSAVADVQTFSAEAIGDDLIILNWTKNNDNDDVMLVWSSDGIFGEPENGQGYSAGEVIPGGGTVLYRGDSTSFAHTDLDAHASYYYKIYSFDDADTYSSGLSDNATAGLGDPDIAVSPLSMQHTMEQIPVVEKQLNIANPSAYGSLEWRAILWPSNQQKGDIFVSKKARNRVSGNFSMDEAPAHDPAKTSLRFDELHFDLLDYFPAKGDGAEYGTATDGNHIYSTNWNGNKFFKYAMDGTYLGEFSIEGAGEIRDLVYDGTYFYGSPNSNTIYQMDFSDQSLVGTIPAPSEVRSIAYDADHDGFWVASGWSGPIRLINRAGNIMQTLNTSVVSVSGLAWENVSGEHPSLWAYTQPTGTSRQILTQIDLTTGQAIESFDVATTGIPGPTRLSGGLTISNQVIPGKWTFLGMSQNDVVWLLDLVPDASWKFFLTPQSGTVLPKQEKDVTVRFDASGLPEGTYHAKIIIDHNAEASDDVSLIIPLTMEVTEGFSETGLEPLAEKVNVYPNPFNNTLTISNASGLKSISLHNLFGQPVLVKEMAGMDEKVINTGSFPSGVYFLIMTGTDDAVRVLKIIKK